MFLVSHLSISVQLIPCKRKSKNVQQVIATNDGRNEHSNLFTNLAGYLLKSTDMFSVLLVLFG